MDVSDIQSAFDEVFDQAVVFHGFTDYLRDYDVFIHATAHPSTGIPTRHLRYRFKHCVRVIATSALSPDVWRRSLDDRLLDVEQADEIEGYVWAVKWQVLYPGMTLVTPSPEAERWSVELGVPFHEALIETNGHNLSLIFSDLTVDVAEQGHAPFVVSG